MASSSAAEHGPPRSPSPRSCAAACMRVNPCMRRGALPGEIPLTFGMATRATTVQISMPQMGESVTEGTVLEWLKQVGDRVEADEPLVEVSTDKVDAEVPAPASGTLTKILADADSTVQVGAVLGEIEVGDDDRRARGPGEPEAPPRPAATRAKPSSWTCVPADGRLGRRGHGARVARSGRGRGGRRRPARRDLDRQGRRRGPLPRGRHGRRDPGRARRDRRRGRGALPHRRRRRRRRPAPSPPEPAAPARRGARATRATARRTPPRWPRARPPRTAST